MKREHGNTDIKSKDHGLYLWCERERENYKNGNLDKDKINLLKKVDFRFVRYFRDSMWAEQYQKLVEYHVSSSFVIC